MTTLVLLPGMDGTEVFFRPLVQALPGSVRTIAVTYPQNGPNRYADLLPLVEAAVAGAKDFYVLGWSFSGPLALMLAAKEPKRTRGVILCASFVRSPQRKLSWIRFAFRTPIVGLLRIARRTPAFIRGYSSEEFKRDKAATWARVSARVLATRARAALGVDVRRQLRACACPILYIAGSRDTVVPRWNADEVVREQPSTRVVTIDGPHLALYSSAEAAVPVIVGFIDECQRNRVLPDEASGSTIPRAFAERSIVEVSNSG